MKRHLKETVQPGIFTEWQEVDVEIYAFIDIGIRVIINDEYFGLVYENDLYDKYHKGQKLKGYIQLVRDDGKIDVSFQPRKGELVPMTAAKILAHLKASGGKSHFHDKSAPAAIRKEFQVSKTVFKQAIGMLYKQGKIKITDEGIELV